MKVLIFENEYAELENSFKAINLLYFNDELEITQYNTSQELGNISNIDDYQAIIVDIDLSLKSQKDGLGIINDIKDYDPSALKKVLILTGSTKVEEKIIEQNLGNIPILLKPLELKNVAQALQKVLKRSKK